MSEIATGFACLAGATAVIGAGVRFGTHYIQEMLITEQPAEDPLVLPVPADEIKSAELVD